MYKKLKFTILLLYHLAQKHLKPATQSENHSMAMQSVLLQKKRVLLPFCMSMQEAP